MTTHSFQIIPVQGLTFSGPSAAWLMRVMATLQLEVGFSFGMLPGVFLGSLLGSWVGREWQLEGFKDGYGMRRYIVGSVLMGFGAMPAGGCAVGAGITGGAIFALTAWIALAFMWLGAALADRLIALPRSPHARIQAPFDAHPKPCAPTVQAERVIMQALHLAV